MIDVGIAPRYCLRELVAVFAVVFFVLMLISLGSRFTGYLQDAAAGELAPEVLWLVLALKMPDFLQIVIPFSLYLSILLTLGRLDADSEMPIFQIANVGPFRLLGWLSWIVIPIVVFIAYFSFIVTPDARAKFLEVLTSQEVVSEFDVIKADTFRTFDSGQRMSYMGQVDRESMTVGDVFLQQRTPTSNITILADRGQYHVEPDTGVRYLELLSGRRYAQDESDRGFSVASFETLTQRIELEGVNRLRDDPSRIPSSSLDANDPKQRLEWHWRLAMPIMTFIVAFIAVGLGRIKPRSGRFGKILPGLLIFVAYYGLILGSMNQLQNSASLATIGFWHVHVLMALVGIYLMRKNWRPV
ncbi:MAG: LPS export ABC transporter permease LptF [Gammaproteobacteria bacterium]|nr:LPS export ABC transporter permease LptF [Gammaproteobacteria bacterium]